VVYTEYRPVPLQHFIFPSGGDGIHLVVDEFGKFREDNFSEAIGMLLDSMDFFITGHGSSFCNIEIFLKYYHIFNKFTLRPLF